MEDIHIAQWYTLITATMVHTLPVTCADSTRPAGCRHTRPAQARQDAHPHYDKAQLRSRTGKYELSRQ